MSERLDVTESVFCMFLARVRTGRFTADDWQTFTREEFTNYPHIESARKQLVSAASELGQSPDCLIPDGLPAIAQEILVSLDPNYA